MDHISIVAMGKGSPVILIPGLSSPRAVWDGAAPNLAKTHRVILVQVNGFSGDDAGANLKPGILDGVVADLDAYIVKNKLQGAAVVGHSMGGLLGMMLAKAHPGDVGKLMIVDSLPFYGMLFGPTATTAMVQPQAAMMRDKMIAGYGKPADAANVEGVANALALKPGSRELVKGWMAAADPRVSGEAMYEDLQTDLRADMAGIKTPMTIVYPWNDARPTKPIADTLYKAAYAAAPHMTYVDIGDAAHFVMLDQPEAFAKALDAFLAS
ncbi:MAG: alpha/beta hydrolase [Sphingomonas sp.]|nr:MAG: alpha/beta hydrolase [Sphingomonas sp.]